MKFIAYLRIKEIPKFLESHFITYLVQLVGGPGHQSPALLQPGLQPVSLHHAFFPEVVFKLISSLSLYFVSRMTSPNPLHVSYLGQILLRYERNPIVLWLIGDDEIMIKANWIYWMLMLILVNSCPPSLVEISVIFWNTIYFPNTHVAA